MKTITIFGSSRPLESEDEYKFAFNLGSRLAERGYRIVTGGYGGIMEAASKGAFEKNANVIGVTVAEFKREPNKFLSEEIRCSNLIERLQKLIKLADAFVILQGGTGTLFELAAVWEMINKKSLERKPVAVHSSMWRDIISIMDKQMELEKRETGVIKCFDSVNEIVDYLHGELAA